MTKALVFDMDGTIVDLYKVKNWLNDLKNENSRPYEIAKPLYDMDSLCAVLGLLRYCGWSIVVTTWLAKNASKDYEDKIRKAKKEWLAKYNFPYDEIHIVKYGTTKADCTRNKFDYQILVDDNKRVRNGWHLGDTINAKNNILEKLIDLLVAEYK